MNDKEMKQAMEGLTLLMRGITGNQDLSVPKELADRYGIDEEFVEECRKKEEE